MNYLSGTKAAVAPVSSLNAPLLTPVGADLLLALRPASIIGRLGVRRVPELTRVLTGTEGAMATWVREGGMIPMSKGSYSAHVLENRKVAGIVVASDELLRSDVVDAESAMLDDLLGACRQALDAAFADPSNAGVVGERPPSVTHPSAGGTLLPSSGSSIAQIDSDLRAAIQALLTAGSDLSKASWVLSQTLASKLALLRGAGGVPAHPGLNVRGGLLAGLPVVVSQGVPTTAISLIDAGLIAMSEAEPELSTSRSGMVDMSTTPGSPGVLQTLFQTDSVALRVTLYTDFYARRPAAATVTGITL